MATATDRLLILIDSSAQGAIKEIDHLTKSSNQADSATDKLGKTMKAGLVAGAAAFMGTGLVAFLNDSVNAYGDAAKAAGDLAAATGSSVDTVSRMTAALEDAGVSAEQSAELLTKFTTNAGKNSDLLDELGVTMKRNADGSIDYAASMVDVVDAIGGIGDASKRNQALVQLFGRQGAAAFQDLYNSGMDLSEAMRLVDKYRVFSADDVRRAAAYDDAMDSLSGSMRGVQFALGRALVPALSVAADALAGVLDVLLQIPGPVYIAVGAFVAFKLAMQTSLAQGLLSQGALLITGLATAMVQTGSAGAIAAAGFNLVKGALVGLMTASGPLLLLTAAVMAVTDAFAHAGKVKEYAFDTENATKSLTQQVDELIKTDSVWTTLMRGDGPAARVQYIRELTSLYEDEARATLDSADATEAQKQAAQRLLDVMGEGTEMEKYARLETAAGQAVREEYIRQMGGMAATSELAAMAMKGVEDAAAQLVISGDVTTQMWQDLKVAATESNRATLEQEQAANLAEDAMGRYAVSIQGVVDWLDKLAGNRQSTEEALGAMQESLTALGSVVDDPATWQNEVVIATAQAEQDVLGFVELLAEQGLTSGQIIELLVGIQERPGTTAEADAIIQGIIGQLSGKENNVPIGVALDPTSVGNAQAGLDPLGNPLFPEVSPVPTGIPSAEEILTGVAAPRTATVEIDVTNPGEASSQIDRATVPRIAKVLINVTNPGEASSQIDVATRPRAAYVWLNVQNVDGASSQINAATAPRVSPVLINITNAWQASEMLDYVARRRVAIIEVDVRGQERATRILNSLTRAAGPAAATAATTTATAPVVHNNWSITVNGAADPNRVVRAIDRWTRDNGRREKVTVTA